MSLDGECPTCNGHGVTKLPRRRKKDPQRIAPCRRCKGTGRVAPPSWMVPGAACWYAPHMDSPKRYAGYIASKPWRLGDPETGALVVNLRDMEPAYRDGARTTVPAAAIWCVTERLASPRPRAMHEEVADHHATGYERDGEAYPEPCGPIDPLPEEN